MEELSVKNIYRVKDNGDAIYYDGFIDPYGIDEALENSIEESIYITQLNEFMAINNPSSYEQFLIYKDKFNELFFDGEIKDQNSINKAFDRIINTFKDYDLYIYEDGKYNKIEDDSFFNKITEIITNSYSLDELDLNHKYLMDFIEYYFINYYGKNIELLKKKGVK